MFQVCIFHICKPSAHCCMADVPSLRAEPALVPYCRYWVIHQPQLFRIYPQVFEVLVRTPTGLTCAATEDMVPAAAPEAVPLTAGSTRLPPTASVSSAGR